MGCGAAAASGERHPRLSCDTALAASAAAALNTATVTGSTGASEKGVHLTNLMPAGSSAGADGATRLQFGGDEARRRWADNRARGWFPTKGLGTGSAPGSEESRQRARTLTLVCVGCGALVNRARARLAAHTAGRTLFVPGDGCASRTCSCHYRPARFACSQRRMASAVASGERLLICWQHDIHDGEIWVQSTTAARAAAATALASLPAVVSA